MRWIVKSHITLTKHLEMLAAIDPNDNETHSLLAHPVISSINREQQAIAAINIVHTRLVHLMQHQESTNDKFLLVLRGTPAQTGDEALLADWMVQTRRISQLGGISMVPGCFSLLREVRLLPEAGINLVINEEGGVDSEVEEADEEDEEDIFLQSLDDNMVSLALEKLGLDEDEEEVEEIELDRYDL